MRKIKLLPTHEINKIAAGQVVDRPANVVKELIENAIDAGATKIELSVKDGGETLIQVSDNGCGMSPEDAKACFLKHATSKISCIDELETIDTFGFRGEALSSISAVSKITLDTKEKESQHSTLLQLEAGKIVKELEGQVTPGTTIFIRDLFYNVPARKKFLKKPETETRQITQLFHAFCFDYLNVHFKMFNNTKLTFNCPPAKDLVSRISQIWGHHFAKNIVPIQTEQKEGRPHIHGAISNHQYSRYDRNYLFFFINRRWVKNYQLSNALTKGYMNVLPPGKYPACFLFIDIDPRQIDINIHPRKEEVKFLHPRSITNLLQTIVKQALEKNLSKQIKQEVVFSSPVKNYDDNFKTLPFDQFLSKQKIGEPTSVIFHGPKSINQQETPKQLSEEQHQGAIKQKNYKIVGQFKKTYILLEKEDGLFFVDQHAAHERILYETFSKRFEDVVAVKLLFPQLISLNHEDMVAIENHLEIFRKNGIEIEPFGQNQLAIKATPVSIKDIDLRDLVQKVVFWTREHQNLDQKEFFKTINEKMHAQMACKAAVKAGDSLTIKQMEELLENLSKTKNRLTCPHGRPTGWTLYIHEIEKKFKRRL